MSFSLQNQENNIGSNFLIYTFTNVRPAGDYCVNSEREVPLKETWSFQGVRLNEVEAGSWSGGNGVTF